MITIAYFSYTGNTERVAKQLKQALGTRSFQFINLVNDVLPTFKQNDEMILVYAIHAFLAPINVYKQLKSLPNAKANIVHLVAVGSHVSELNLASSVPLIKILLAKNYQIGINRVVAMPLTIVYEQTPVQRREIILEMEKDVLRMATDILQKKSDPYDVHWRYKWLAQIGKVEKQAAKLFGRELYATNDCIHCGRCWLECPMKNISCSKQQKPKFHFACSMCLKCIYDCPKQAIRPRFSKFMMLKSGYKQDLT